MALKQTARQSSRYIPDGAPNSYYAENAVDGVLPGDTRESAQSTCTHTVPDTQDLGWWTLTFSQAVDVTRFLIYNRGEERDKKIINIKYYFINHLGFYDQFLSKPSFLFPMGVLYPYCSIFSVHSWSPDPVPCLTTPWEPPKIRPYYDKQKKKTKKKKTKKKHQQKTNEQTKQPPPQKKKKKKKTNNNKKKTTTRKQTNKQKKTQPKKKTNKQSKQTNETPSLSSTQSKINRTLLVEPVMKSGR